MSVQVNTYIIWGVILPYKDFMHLGEVFEAYDDDPFKKFERKPDHEITVLFDGMNGNYIVVGHVVARTRNHDHFEVPLIIDTMGAADRFELQERIAELIGQRCDKPRPIVISHFR